MANKSIPQRLLEDDTLQRKFKVALTEALAARLDESEWKKLAVAEGLESRITHHHRFIRALQFGDPDFEGHVLELVGYLFDHRSEVVVDLFERDTIQRWFKANARNFIAVWADQPDPVIEALAHSLGEVEAVRRVIDLSQYTKRVQAALPDDPHQAIGATKDMLEATMRTILHRRGVNEVEKFDFPGLATRCFAELGLTASTAPTTQGERYLRKIASSAKTMIETANELRNLAGTGHGRVIGEVEDITADDASMVASSGYVLTAWLLRRADEA